LSENNEVIGCGSSRNERIEGDHTKAFFPALIEVLLVIPDGHEIEVLSTLKYAVEELGRTPAQRDSTGYFKSDGKTLLEDHAALKRVDELIIAKDIRLSARKPIGYEEMCHVKALKDELGKHPKVSPFGAAT
jgi:hypothetical protein